MRNENIFSLFEQLALEVKNDVFLETEHGATYRYADLLLTTARYANALAALGVVKGDRVAVQVRKSAESLLLYLAVLRLGAIYLPFNTAYTKTETTYFLSNAQPRIYLCDPKDYADKSQLANTLGVQQVLTLGTDGSGSLIDLAAKESDSFPTTKVRDDDVAVILYTSGTTGRSKGAMLTHANLINNGQALTQLWAFSRRDVLLHALPIFHGHGLFVACHCALFSQSRILFMDKFVAERVLQLIPRATVMMGVPTFYVRLLELFGFDRELCTNMRLFISGSAPLSVETIRSFKERTDHVILERYGTTETIIMTSNPYDGQRRTGSVGKAIKGVEMRIADNEDRLLQANVCGNIQTRGLSVMKGYWNMPEQTEKSFTADGWFRTGDIGLITESGYLTIMGRASDMIITYGYNVYPKEIENAIDMISGVVESAVIGIPDRKAGEMVIAVVVREGLSPKEEDIIAHLGTVLAKYKVPKRVFFTHKIPRNVTGKVPKNKLQATYSATLSAV